MYTASSSFKSLVVLEGRPFFSTLLILYSSVLSPKYRKLFFWLLLGFSMYFTYCYWFFFLSFFLKKILGKNINFLLGKIFYRILIKNLYVKLNYTYLISQVFWPWTFFKFSSSLWPKQQGHLSKKDSLIQNQPIANVDVGTLSHIEDFTYSCLFSSMS